MLVGWLYYQPITVGASTGAGTGYQVSVPLTMIDLNNHANSDFGDVRFTASDGTTLLTYFISNIVSGVSASFLVKVTDDLSSVPATILVFYGNTSATTTSTTAVYDAYDPALVDGSANYTERAIGGGHLRMFGWDIINKEYSLSPTVADHYFYEINGLTGPNLEMSCDFKPGVITGKDDQFGVIARFTNSSSYYDCSNVQANDVGQKYLWVALHSAVSLGSNNYTNYFSPNTYYTHLVRIYGSTIWEATYLTSTGVMVESRFLQVTDSTYASGSFGLHLYCASGNGMRFRNVVVRHYVSPEPAVTSMGPEVSGIGLITLPSAPGSVTLSNPANHGTIP